MTPPARDSKQSLRIYLRFGKRGHLKRKNGKDNFEIVLKVLRDHFWIILGTILGIKLRSGDQMGAGGIRSTILFKIYVFY